MSGQNFSSPADPHLEFPQLQFDQMLPCQIFKSSPSGKFGPISEEIFWYSLVESAAAAEVVLNLVLPSLVCSRHGGLWRPPNEWLLILLTLAMNLAGTFLEGHHWKGPSFPSISECNERSSWGLPQIFTQKG